MTRFAALVALVLVMVAAGSASAAWVCQPLHMPGDSHPVGLGEARYRVSYGSVYSPYANAYYDSGDELSLTSGIPVGWAPESASFEVGFIGKIEDLAVDECGEAELQMKVWEKGATGCTKGSYFVGLAYYKSKTCEPGINISTPSDVKHFFWGIISRLCRSLAAKHRTSMSCTSWTTNTDFSCSRATQVASMWRVRRTHVGEASKVDSRGGPGRGGL